MRTSKNFLKICLVLTSLSALPVLAGQQPEQSPKPIVTVPEQVGGAQVGGEQVGGAQVGGAQVGGTQAGGNQAAEQMAGFQAAGSATATIITPIAIAPLQDLAFGKISANAGGTVTIDTDGIRSKEGSVILLNTGSVQTEGKFNVTGDIGATYAITLPSASIVVSDGKANSMDVNAFVSNLNGIGIIGKDGAAVHVGGTLAVAADQAGGSYAGTYSVMVEYN